MTQPSRRKPAYFLIAEDLRGRIEQQGLTPGDRLPAELELVDHYKVARKTVRRALEILQSEGLIARRRGRNGGTFVRAMPPTLTLNSPESILSQLGGTGRKVSVELLTLRKTGAQGAAAIALQIEEGIDVWEMRRVHLVDDCPVLVSHYTIPAEIAHHLDESHTQLPISDLVESFGVKLAFKCERVSVSVARPDEQRLLNMGGAQPVLRLSRSLLRDNGDIIAYAEESVRPDATLVEVTSGVRPS